MVNRRVAATGDFIEVASSATTVRGNRRILRFVLRSLQGKTFRALLFEEMQQLWSEMLLLCRVKYKFIRCEPNGTTN
jgi:hypothetical protein